MSPQPTNPNANQKRTWCCQTNIFDPHLEGCDFDPHHDQGPPYQFRMKEVKVPSWTAVRVTPAPGQVIRHGDAAVMPTIGEIGFRADGPVVWDGKEWISLRPTAIPKCTCCPIHGPQISDE